MKTTNFIAAIVSFAIGLVAAMAGGYVCANIAPATPAPLWLADTTMADAVAHAGQPVWVALLNPLVGATGVLMGAGPRRTRR